MADERSVRIPMTVAVGQPVQMSVEPMRVIRGIDGVSPTAEVEDIDGGHRITITDADGEHVFDVMNGERGQQGETGPAGADGQAGQDGAPGKDGQDGAPGVGVPTGGSQGQVLAKTSGTDFATAWVTPYAGTVTETVTGSTPSIAAQADHRYICGEVSTLAITTPASGIIDIVFESGSTPTVLTVTPPSGMTMKWANGFDPTALEANTVYEINIMDGVYGVAAAWT